MEKLTADTLAVENKAGADIGRMTLVTATPAVEETEKLSRR